MSSVRLEQPAVDEIAALDATLNRWEGALSIASGFAAGDLGWALRDGPERAASQLLVARDGDGYAAIGWREGEVGLWLRIDPSRLLDHDLADEIAAAVVEHGLREVATASVPAAIRRALGVYGFAIDPDPWVHLWQPLTDAHIVDVPGVFATATDALIEQRVAVQRSAFERSTFTREKWEAMATGPSFMPALDLVALNDEGAGVAALTAWLPGPDACGMIEPMGTHADHRRQGHGARVLRACYSELRKLGASGVRVFTPRDNQAAVATYRSAGFLVIDYDTTMVRP